MNKTRTQGERDRLPNASAAKASSRPSSRGESAALHDVRRPDRVPQEQSRARCASKSCTRWRPSVLAGVSGITIDDRWFCSGDCVEQTMCRLLCELPGPRPFSTAPPPPHLRLGVLLRHLGALSTDQLHEALERQRTSGLKLGKQAQVLYGVDRAVVLRALATQAGARYLTTVDPGTVREAPGKLSREAISALGLIPLSRPAGDGVIRLAAAAPVRWDAVQALRRLAGWNPYVYLVEDDSWRDLVDHYGTGVPREATREIANAVVVSGPREAANRIATIATATRRASLTDAHWNPYTLVRVHSGATVQDVLFPRHREEGTIWQAARPGSAERLSGPGSVGRRA